MGDNDKDENDGVLDYSTPSNSFSPLKKFITIVKFLILPKTLLTFGYCVSFASLGLVLASLGPVLLDLGNAF